MVATTPIASAMPSAGAMNCQTDMPAARATTSSSLRVRLMKAAMAPNSTAKGSTCSVTAGTRNSDRKAIRGAVASLTSLARRSRSTKSSR